MKSKLSDAQQARFFSQLAALLEAGLSVSPSLSSAGRDCPPAFKHSLQQVTLAVESGQDLAAALAASGVFDAWTIQLIQAAQYSGALAELCQRLAVAAERRKRHKRLYRSIGRSLTVAIVSLTIAIAALAPGLLAVALIPAIAGLILLGWTIPQIAWHFPISRQVMQSRSMLYFSELELPLKCGIPLFTALELIGEHLPEPVLATKLNLAAQQVRRGHPLSQGLQGAFPPLAIQMIRTGEETGNLDNALQKLAEYYESDLERQLRQLQGILRPFSVIAAGSLVLALGIFAIGLLINRLPG